jgi:hypothetical protein
MGEDLERLKQRVPLLEYLQRHHWRGHRVGAGPEFTALCPLHEDSHPSFYVNVRKNLFYCHGCGCGGDLIRFVELSRHLSFRESVAYVQEELAPPPNCSRIRPPSINLNYTVIRKAFSISLSAECTMRGSSKNSASAMRAAATCALTCRPSATPWNGCLKRA